MGSGSIAAAVPLRVNRVANLPPRALARPVILRKNAALDLPISCSIVEKTLHT